MKAVDNGTPTAGATVNYAITVSALGPATSTGVVATDTFPSGLTFENATTSVGSYASSTGTWTIGTLSPNATATLMIAASVASNEAGQVITNTATVSQLSSLADPNLANNSSSISITVQSAPCTIDCGGGGGGGGGSTGVSSGGGATSNVSVDVSGGGTPIANFVTAGGGGGGGVDAVNIVPSLPNAGSAPANIVPGFPNTGFPPEGD